MRPMVAGDWVRASCPRQPVPSAFVTFLIKASVEPAILEGKATTVISSPVLRESLVMPSAIIEVKEAISPTHCVVFPF